MIKRIVKLTFQPEKVATFLENFQLVKNKILAQEGCRHLELLKAKGTDNVYFTYSFWNSEDDLNNYRHSELFKGVWAKTKVLFSDKPAAWSLEHTPYTTRGGLRIDLSHTITEGLVTYKGLPAPIMCDYLSREESKKHYTGGAEFQIGKIEMVANTGTYVDSPFHRYPHGCDLSELLLNRLAHLEGIVIRVGEDVKAIDVSYFEGKDLEGRAVLVHTNWSRHWNTEQYYEDNPFLTKAAAEYLVSQNVALVGIDSHNIDDLKDLSRPVHSVLLGSDIPIVEHMTNLHRLPDLGFYFSAVPPKVKGFGTFPVRAFAVVF